MEETLAEILNNLATTLQTPASQWSVLPRSLAGVALMGLAFMVYHLTRLLLFRLASNLLARRQPTWSRFLQKHRLFNYPTSGPPAVTVWSCLRRGQ